MTQNLSELCKSCNGVCCKIFCLRASKKEIFLDFISLKRRQHRPASRFDLLIMLIFFCRLKKSIQEETAKYCSAGFAYKCLALSRTNRCLIYHFRPKLCRIYDCNGAEQIAHSLLNLPRLNLLPENENSSEDLMKKAIKEEELCTKTSS